MKQTIVKHITLLLLALLTMSASTLAQNRRTEKVHALKIAYMTDKGKLTSSQAERFWPVYNQYENDLNNLRQSFRKQYRKQNEIFTQEEARKYVEDNLDYQDALVDLKRRYKDEFLRIISPQQLTDMYVAEREFRQMLIQKLRERRGRR